MLSGDTMKENYQKKMDAVVASLPEGEKPRLLLQSCCGPCSSYVLEALTPHFRVTVLYYNPNIQPRAEYDRRLETQRQIIAALPTPTPVDILECDYDGDAYDAAVRGLEAAETRLAVGGEDLEGAGGRGICLRGGHAKSL